MHTESNTMFDEVWYNLHLLTSQHRPMFGGTMGKHHQLAGLHPKTSLIVPCLVTAIHSQTKLIAGNPSIMGKSIPLETSQD